jgi:hypothetical protein
MAIEPIHLDSVAALMAAESTSMCKTKGELDTEFVKRIVCAKPGHSVDDTSIDAADRIAPETELLRNLVLDALKSGGKTVHETADMLERTVPAVQPRFSELRKLNLIVDSGDRRLNAASGRNAIVWDVAA